MLILRTLPASEAPKLDDLTANVGCEAAQAEADSFDDPMVACVVGLSDTLQAEKAEMKTLRGCMVRLARQVAQ